LCDLTSIGRAKKVIAESESEKEQSQSDVDDNSDEEEGEEEVPVRPTRRTRHASNMPSQSQAAFLPTRALSTIEVDGGSELESLLLVSQSQRDSNTIDSSNAKSNALNSQVVDDKKNDNDEKDEKDEESVDIGEKKKSSMLKKKSALDRKFGSDSSDGEDNGLSSYL